MLYTRGGVSELLTAKLAYDSGFQDVVLYCQLDNGRPCHKCRKCFRKNLELEFWEYISSGELRSKEYWNYDMKAMKYFYGKSYKSMGHLFNFLSQSVPSDNKPKWFKHNLKYCNANTDWVRRYYPILNLIPSKYKQVVGEALDTHFTKMDDADIRQIENYSYKNYLFRDFQETIELSKTEE